MEADEKEIEFVFDYAKELETCMVMQDKRWLGEAVINVLDNAIKYSQMCIRDSLNRQFILL